MRAALTAALKTAQIEPRDGALVALARMYATQLDKDPACSPKVGPVYTQILGELGMTPKSRTAGKGGGAANANPRRTKLDELRDRRRANGAAPVDPAAP
jgi:hypothetical protein